MALLGFEIQAFQGLLGGSWVVTSGVISKVTIVVTHIRRLIAILITTHEPPSRAEGLTGFLGSRVDYFGV